MAASYPEGCVLVVYQAQAGLGADGDVELAAIIDGSSPPYADGTADVDQT